MNSVIYKMLNKYENKGVQTESNFINNINQDFKTHLDFAGQTYFEHFKDAIKYSYKSLKASFYFFIHALIPDVFTQSGSNCIHNLNDTIKEKYNQRIAQLNNTN